MNARDRDTLLALLCKLWDDRNGYPGGMPTLQGELTTSQTDLLAACIRIAGNIDGEPNDLPNPWPAEKLHKYGQPRPEFVPPPSRLTMLANWLDKRIGPLPWRRYR